MHTPRIAALSVSTLLLSALSAQGLTQRVPVVTQVQGAANRPASFVSSQHRSERESRGCKRR